VSSTLRTTHADTPPAKFFLRLLTRAPKGGYCSWTIRYTNATSGLSDVSLRHRSKSGIQYCTGTAQFRTKNTTFCSSVRHRHCQISIPPPTCKDPSITAAFQGRCGADPCYLIKKITPIHLVRQEEEKRFCIGANHPFPSRCGQGMY
jgi:hypothetical protein